VAPPLPLEGEHLPVPVGQRAVAVAVVRRGVLVDRAGDRVVAVEDLRDVDLFGQVLFADVVLGDQVLSRFPEHVEVVQVQFVLGAGHDSDHTRGHRHNAPAYGGLTRQSSTVDGQTRITVSPAASNSATVSSLAEASVTRVSMRSTGQIRAKAWPPSFELSAMI